MRSDSAVYAVLTKLTKPRLRDLAYTAYELAGERVFVSVSTEDLREMIDDWESLNGATDGQLQAAVDHAWNLEWGDEYSNAKQFALEELRRIMA